MIGSHSLRSTLVYRLILSALAVPFTASALSAQTPRGVGHVFSANLSGGNVTEHDPGAITYVGNFVEAGAGGLTGATGIAFGPDGDLFVASSRTDAILRFDGETGELVGPFIQDSILHSPFSVIFGPNGDLFVSSGTDHQVLRYDGETGVFRGVVLDGLRVPIGLRFGPDGALYVANAGEDQIVRVDLNEDMSTVFIEGGLRFPSDLVFTDDGSLYVTSAITRQILEYDADTGAFRKELHVMPDGSAPVGIDVALDGSLVVADFAGDRIVRIDRTSGDVTEMVGGLAGPENIVVKRPSRRQ